jgi:hypothetical protein
VLDVNAGDLSVSDLRENGVVAFLVDLVVPVFLELVTDEVLAVMMVPLLAAATPALTKATTPKVMKMASRRRAPFMFMAYLQFECERYLLRDTSRLIAVSMAKRR